MSPLQSRDVASVDRY